MAENKKLTILKGGKDLNRGKYRFIKAIGTKTRLMGVVALKLHWINEEDIHFVQWFLLDAEEHGIYDYISVKTPIIEETDKYTGQFMESLGGEKVELSRKEAYYLIQAFGTDNKVYKKPLPKPEGYKFILNAKRRLNAKEIVELNNKIFEEVILPTQLINFFTMRSVAKDLEGIKYLLNDNSSSNLSDYIPFKRAGVLLKNSIRNSVHEDIYLADSIVEGKGCYYHVKWRLRVIKYKGSYRIDTAKILRRQIIPPEEVALEIQNPEYIKLYKIKGSPEAIMKVFDDAKGKDFLKYKFLQGTMYVEFQKNNDHVLRYLYHIGGDIKGIYFINHFNQLIACYYHPDDLRGIDEFIHGELASHETELMDTFQRKGSIIYEYAEVEEVDFIEYLNDID